jgi:cell division protein FtsB
VGKLLRFPRRGKKDLKTRPLFPGLVGTDARPAYFASDASAAAVGARAADEELLRKLRFRKRASVVVLTAVFVAGSLTFVFADRGLLDNRRQRRLLAERTAAVEAHQLYVTGLKRDTERLKTDPHASERIAREELGYSEKGEILLLLPPEELDATTRSAIVPVASSTPAP